MKTISNGLRNALQEEVTTLATCWKMTRRDTQVMGFTDHDRDISFDGINYTAKSGFTPTAVTASASLNVDNLDVEGMLDAESISTADIMAGIYDFAEIEVFMVNYTDLSQGRMILRRGWLGEINLREGRFVAEVRGLTQKLAQNVGELYSAACRAKLGDGRCKVNLSAYTKTGTVGDASGRHDFTDATRTEASGYFAGGAITFTSGSNQGLSMEIKEYGAGRFVLVLPMPFEVSVGDAYTAIAGCDKSFSSCKAKFANSINFRGEPHVPGMDRLLETSSTRSIW